MKKVITLGNFCYYFVWFKLSKGEKKPENRGVL